MKIESGKLVKVEYELKVEGEVIESSTNSGPLEYVQGSGALPFGLETVFAGLGIGEEKAGSVPVELPTMPMQKSEFPEDFDVKEGGAFAAKNAEGQDVSMVIAKVEGDLVHVQPFHPLAGKSLDYKVKVLEIKDQA
jgi:FKBP-type peptidyl-prolyl cis-trans isomerase SlyD